MLQSKLKFSKVLSVLLAATIALSTFSLLSMLSASAEEIPEHQFEGFENGLNTVKESTVFELYNSNGDNDGNVYSGSYSLHNPGKNSNFRPWYLNSELKVEAGKRYAVSFWYKGGTESKVSAALSLFADETAGAWINGTKPDQWVYYSTIITATDSNTNKHFGILAYENADLYFDDIRVDEVGSSYYSESFDNCFGEYRASGLTADFGSDEEHGGYITGKFSGNQALYLPIYLETGKTYSVSFEYKTTAWFYLIDGNNGYSNSKWSKITDKKISGTGDYLKFGSAGSNTGVFCIDNIVVREQLSATYDATAYAVIGVSDSKPLYNQEVTYSLDKIKDGYTFAGWKDESGVIVSEDNPYKFTITKNTKLSATFDEVKLYTCKALTEDSAKGTANVDVESVYGGSTATFTATPADGYEFAEWVDSEGKTVSTLNPYRITVKSDTTLTAKFTTAEKGVQKEGFENSSVTKISVAGGTGTNEIYNSYSDGAKADYVYSGYNSLLISRSTGNYGVRLGNIAFKSGKTYKLSFKYRKTDEDDSNGWFYVIDNNVNSYVRTATANWQTFSEYFSPVNDCTLLISTTACKGLLIDEIVVREVNIYNQRQGFEYDDVDISNQDPNFGESVIYTKDKEVYDPANVKSGTKSLEIKHKDVKGNLRTKINGFTLTAGKTYNLTFSYKTPQNAIWFYAINSTIAPINTEKSGEWQTYSIDYTPAANASAIEFGTTTEGALLYLDDIVLREKANYSVTANKESARIDFVNDVTADTIYVSDEIGFTVKQTNANDSVAVKVNGEECKPDTNKVYTVSVPETMNIELNITGEYSNKLPDAGKGNNGEILNKYDENVAMKEIWYGDTVYHESVFFYDSDFKDTHITRKTAKLLYPAETVVSLRSYDLNTYYVEGVDYNIVEGQIVLTQDSSIPVYTGALTALKESADSETDPTVAKGESTYAKSYPIDDTYGLKLIGSDKNHNACTVMVTYTHSTEWNNNNGEGYNPKAVKAQGSKLTNLYNKLNGESTEDINVLVYGASSATGASSSGANVNYVLFDIDGNPVKSSGREPYAPAYFELAVNALVKEYGNKNKVNYYNIALGGKDSGWGLRELETRIGYLNNYYTKVNGSKFEVSPDVIIIAFNGNDFSTPIDTFESNIKGIVDKFREKYPNVDIILPSEKMNNNHCTIYSEERALAMQSKLQAVASKYENGVICAPVTDTFVSMLKSKQVEDYLSNNINHGSDFYARVFAQVIFNAAERHITGDANVDNSVNICDLVRLNNYITENDNTPFNFKSANINLDNKVDNFDFAALRKMLLGIAE